MVIISLLEILAVGLVIYGFIHEDKFIDFEEKIAERFKK